MSGELSLRHPVTGKWKDEVGQYTHKFGTGVRSALRYIFGREQVFKDMALSEFT